MIFNHTLLSSMGHFRLEQPELSVRLESPGFWVGAAHTEKG